MESTMPAIRARGRHGVFLGALVLIFAATPAAALQAPVPDSDPPGAASPQPGVEEAPVTPPHAVPAGMDVERLDRLIRRVDDGAQRDGNAWQLDVDGTRAQVIADPKHDRMRVVVAIAAADALPAATMQRLLQANFDSALDSRYGIARGLLWATYIHPLSPLTSDQFLSGLAQTVLLARNYGTTFSSGALSFGGGDSQDLLRELLEKGEGI